MSQIKAHIRGETFARDTQASRDLHLKQPKTYKEKNQQMRNFERE